MEIEVRKEPEGERVCFFLKGNIDEQGAAALKARFLETDEPALKDVVFDFTQVIHIGSAGIGKLLLFYKDLADRGGVIHIKNPTDAVYDLFKVLKLDTIFEISRS
jgi:anti-anti-sigma factor